MRSRVAKRFAVGGAVVLVSVFSTSPTVFAVPAAPVEAASVWGGAGALDEPQPASNADFSGNGANVQGPYDSTRDGSPSENGNGFGAAIGKPCAGCVGRADNKNPPGQLPGGSDANNGYECDGNSGIGKTNPAHTGCVPAVTETPVVPALVPVVPVITDAAVLGVTFTAPQPASVLATEASVAAAAPALAVTGPSFLTSLALVGGALVFIGALLQWLPTRRRVLVPARY